MAHLARIERFALTFPEAVRVDIEAWDGEPTFRVRNKNFVFCAPDGSVLTVKLPKDEAEAVVASDGRVSPCGYGLGRHGWVTARLPARLAADQWVEVEEWIETSYRLVAPRRLVAMLDADAEATPS
ncbi:MAG: MmcQ/YjbR family DNA-binding protein [Ilumatobacteraceae bacterium]